MAYARRRMHIWWGRVAHFAINIEASDSKDESSQQSSDSDTDEVGIYTVLYRQAIINLIYYDADHDAAYDDDDGANDDDGEE